MTSLKDMRRELHRRFERLTRKPLGEHKVGNPEAVKRYTLWIERLRKAGMRDPEDPFKMIPPSDPRTKRQIQKLEIELAYAKGEIDLDEYHRRYERLEAPVIRTYEDLEKEFEGKDPVDALAIFVSRYDGLRRDYLWEDLSRFLKSLRGKLADEDLHQFYKVYPNLKVPFVSIASLIDWIPPPPMAESTKTVIEKMVEDEGLEIRVIDRTPNFIEYNIYNQKRYAINRIAAKLKRRGCSIHRWGDPYSIRVRCPIDALRNPVEERRFPLDSDVWRAIREQGLGLASVGAYWAYEDGVGYVLLKFKRGTKEEHIRRAASAVRQLGYDVRVRRGVVRL